MKFEKHAQGGFSEVFRSRTNNSVIKKISKYDMYLSESNFLRRLSGVNGVPSLIGGYEEGDDFYIEMDFVEGVTLASYVRNNDVDFDSFVRIFTRLVSIISEVHRRGVVHLDIKPLNIIVDKSGNPNVIDFGLSKNIGKKYSAEGFRADPAFYPGEKYYGVEGTFTDVYLLASTMHYLASGSMPFGVRHGHDEFTRIYRHSFYDREKIKGGKLAELFKSMLSDYRTRPSLDEVMARLEALDAVDLESFRSSDYLAEIRDFKESEAELSLRKCALKGIPYACFEYAKTLDDREDKFEFYSLAANQGYGMAYNDMALILEKEGSDQAGAMFEKAAQAGCPVGMSNFSNVLRAERYGYSYDVLKAERLDRDAAFQFQRSASLRFGMKLLEKGDAGTALRFLKVAAYRGKELAMAQLYTLYAHGVEGVVEKSEQQSDFWISKIPVERREKLLSQVQSFTEA